MSKCVYVIEGYGVCGRTASHPVHEKMGISPREHPFKRELTGNEETMTLTEKNIPLISKRSGMSEDELEIMLEMAKKQGRELTLRYEVVEDV